MSNHILKKMNTFGEEIRYHRERLDMTLKELSTLLKIDFSLLAKIERNERNPTRRQIAELANHLGIDEIKLLMVYLSDSIADVVYKENADFHVLKIAEKKLKYLKDYGTKQ